MNGYFCNRYKYRYEFDTYEYEIVIKVSYKSDSTNLEGFYNAGFSLHPAFEKRFFH